MPQTDSREGFGATIRRLREKKKYTLREFAKMIEVSPTYLSMIERGEFKPPAEDKVIAIARHLGEDPDALLALAGRVQSDLSEIIKERPEVMASFLRRMRHMPTDDIQKLLDQTNKKRRK